jgi:hypothetical protein
VETGYLLEGNTTLIKLALDISIKMLRGLKRKDVIVIDARRILKTQLDTTGAYII